jgi:DNA polymerase II small subunit
MVCVSDIHFGNREYMKREFDGFLAWLRGEAGTPEMRRIAAKTHYVIIPGDVIEGVGIYPSQEKDLCIPDIYDQYTYCDDVLSQIPEEKHVIIIPGNHDIGRLSEPQGRLPKELLPKLNARANTHFLSNPSIVRLHAQPGFPGFTTTLYHGGSFIYYGNNVPRLFREGGVNNPCAIMQYLLQRRHLAPAHASTLTVPDVEVDDLILDEIPDFLITGHLHMAQEKTWRGITMLSCSCWVPITDYQEKSGLRCDPGKLALVNLQTRAVQLCSPSELTGERYESDETPTATSSEVRA